MIDPIKYYNLEQFLFNDVRKRFHKKHSIGAFDFFSIIIWKSNRSKSKVAKRLLNKTKGSDLEQISRSISAGIAKAKTDKDKMKCLIVDWGFKLAIASAILTILYPDRFTIYDYRAAGQVKEGEKLKNEVEFEEIWAGYVAFMGKGAAIPHGKNLREKDYYLFGKSRMEDLNADLKNGFKK